MARRYAESRTRSTVTRRAGGLLAWVFAVFGKTKPNIQNEPVAILIDGPCATTFLSSTDSHARLKVACNELAECAMSIRIDRLHPAVKHGAYSATDVLPGESRAEFDKLHRGLIAELAPTGVLEDDIVRTIARLVWRQNLTTLRIAERAQSRRAKILCEKKEVPESCR